MLHVPLFGFKRIPDLRKICFKGCTFGGGGLANSATKRRIRIPSMKAYRRVVPEFLFAAPCLVQPRVLSTSLTNYNGSGVEFNLGHVA